MKKIILIFGAISGLICGGMYFLSTPADGQMDFENGQLYGYLTMFIALSSIFFAIKQYRDKYNGGTIDFMSSLKIGLGITCVAGLIYVICWEFYYANYASDFTDQYLAYLKESLAEKGSTAAEIETEMADTTAMMESYKTNMPMRLGMTFMEIFPVGLIISLIASVLFGKILKGK